MPNRKNRIHSIRFPKNLGWGKFWLNDHRDEAGEIGVKSPAFITHTSLIFGESHTK